MSNKKSVSQYRAMLAAVRPRDQHGANSPAVGRRTVADLVQIEVRLTTLKAELKQAVSAHGSQL